MLIVDDDDGFRQRVRTLLDAEPDIEVVGEAADGYQAVAEARACKPDVALVDIRMPGLTGIGATRLMVEEMPALKVLMLTMYDVKEYREAARESGACGYVVKRSMLDELVPAIRTATRAENVACSAPG